MAMCAWVASKGLPIAFSIESLQERNTTILALIDQKMLALPANTFRVAITTVKEAELPLRILQFRVGLRSEPVEAAEAVF